MEQLTKSLLKADKVKVDYNKQPEAPLQEKVLQFGEGNFLRAFVDWMIDELNSKNKFNGSVVVSNLFLPVLLICTMTKTAYIL